MTSLYQSLRARGLSQHVAWRASFAIVPCVSQRFYAGHSSDIIYLSAPVLIFVAVLTLIYGTDHPAGKWSERHNIPATEIANEEGHDDHDDSDEKLDEKKVHDTSVTIQPVEKTIQPVQKIAAIDVAVNERLTVKAALKMLMSPLTWLPALAYLTTFGAELAIDSQMSSVLFGLYNNKIPGFNQTTAGYYTSIL